MAQKYTDSTDPDPQHWSRPCLPFGVRFFYLEPNSEQAEEAKRVHLAALVGVGEEEGAEAPGREYGEGRYEGGRGGRAQVVQAHTLKG